MNREEFEALTESDLERRFDEHIDETNATVELMGMTYLPSTVFKDVDPIAYDVEFSNFTSTLEDEIEDE